MRSIWYDIPIFVYNLTLLKWIAIFGSSKLQVIILSKIITNTNYCYDISCAWHQKIIDHEFVVYACCNSIISDTYKYKRVNDPHATIVLATWYNHSILLQYWSKAKINKNYNVNEYKYMIYNKFWCYGCQGTSLLMHMYRNIDHPSCACLISLLNFMTNNVFMHVRIKVDYSISLIVGMILYLFSDSSALKLLLSSSYADLFNIYTLF